jgi:hypothetical protein
MQRLPFRRHEERHAKRAVFLAAVERIRGERARVSAVRDQDLVAEAEPQRAAIAAAVLQIDPLALRRRRIESIGQMPVERAKREKQDDERGVLRNMGRLLRS